MLAKMLWRQRFIKEMEAICLTRGIFRSFLQKSQHISRVIKLIKQGAAFWTWINVACCESNRLARCCLTITSNHHRWQYRCPLYSDRYQTSPIFTFFEGLSLQCTDAALIGSWALFSSFKASKMFWFLLDLLHQSANHHWGEHNIILQVEADQHLQKSTM